MIKVLIISLMFLTGCATFTAPQKHPVLSEEFELSGGNSGDLKLIMSHTTANRRVIFSDLYTGSICVEPPPESANQISDSLAAILDADINDKAKLAAEVSKSSSQKISQLYRRTQAVQMYRDAVFSLCQEKVNSYMLGSNLDKDDRDKWNKAINTKYEGKFDVLLIKSIELLKYEIPKFYETERLRFVAEIVKPIVVCESETKKEPEKLDKKDKNTDNAENNAAEIKYITSTKSGCKAVLPNGASELIKAYSETITKEK